MGSEVVMPRAQRFTKLTLVALMGIYHVLNVILFFTACVAWSKERKASHEAACNFFDALECGVVPWVIYSIIAAAAFIVSVTSGILAFHAVIGSRGVPANPLYFYRCTLFTLLVLIPVIFVGWSDLTFINHDVIGGMSGTFIFRTVAATSKSADIACGLAHFNVLFGAFSAGIAAALAPPAEVPRAQGGSIPA
ncbi:hypothetical protein HIM_07772 [Hirsutella minnesotensis 3608]|uniref:MARVEL domain-containing protein n=1 Tax=Hirsutella minnesotensis 3608 TaxID=1043627 RepID=A0A0F7ZTB6_9HYPO|nr:hypothetical protein HIM_07772 [Hirsutella minnesotensis 3608]